MGATCCSNQPENGELTNIPDVKPKPLPKHSAENSNTETPSKETPSNPNLSNANITHNNQSDSKRTLNKEFVLEKERETSPVIENKEEEEEEKEEEKEKEKRKRGKGKVIKWEDYQTLNPL